MTAPSQQDGLDRADPPTDTWWDRNSGVLVATALTVVGAGLSAAIVRPAYLAYYRPLGLSPRDGGMSALDFSASQVLAWAASVAFACLVVGVVAVLGVNLGVYLRARMPRLRARRDPSTISWGLVVVSIGHVVASVLMDLRPVQFGFGLVGTSLALLAYVFVVATLLGTTSGWQPTSLEWHWRRWPWQLRVSTGALLLTLAVLSTWSLWSAARQAGIAVRVGEEPNAVVTELFLDVLDEPVLLQPRGEDVLNLCGGPASAALVARGDGFNHVVVHPPWLAPGEPGPVVPLPDDLYLVTVVTRAQADASADLCAAPLERP